MALYAGTDYKTSWFEIHEGDVEMKLLLIALSLVCLTACGNTIGVNNVNYKVDAEVNGARLNIGNNVANGEAERLERDRRALLRELEEVRAQLAARDSLIAGQMNDLRQQSVTLLERVQLLTERLASLRQNDAGLRNQLEELRRELARERAARETAEQRVQETDEYNNAAGAENEKTTWSVAAVENLTCRRVRFSVLSDTGTWERFSLNPRAQLTFTRRGENVQMIYDSQQLSLDSIQVISDEPPNFRISEGETSYFGFDEGGYIELYSNG